MWNSMLHVDPPVAAAAVVFGGIIGWLIIGRFKK